MSCPAAITIAGIEYFCQNDSKSHHLPKRHWANAGQPGEPAYWTQHVTPPKPLTLVEWLEQEAPFNEVNGQLLYGFGRQAVLDAAARWEPPAPEPIDLAALIQAIRPHTYGKVLPTTIDIAKAVVAHLRLETK